MKLISSNRYISLLILSISFLPLYAEEQIDIWNKENKENSKPKEKINNINNDTVLQKIRHPIIVYCGRSIRCRNCDRLVQ